MVFYDVEGEIFSIGSILAVGNVTHHEQSTLVMRTFKAEATASLPGCAVGTQNIRNSHHLRGNDKTLTQL
jgi:hypothetical protein